ncbi:MAG: phosphotransferase [Actinobacteria bacterium]|nr:phosphotransferase [Actinomycetota bacterium]
MTGSTSRALFGIGSLTERGTPVTPAAAERLAVEQWGIAGAATSLPAEIDENFRIDVGGEGAPEGSFLLKALPADQDAATADLVTAVLLHLEGRPGVAAQRLVPTLAGRPLAEFTDADGVARRARMTTFLEGPVLRSVVIDAELRRALGATLARLALALRDFDHPGADRDLSWDLRHAGRMSAMLAELAPSPRRERLAEALRSFDAEVVPRLDRLPVQVVHNDLSRDNAVLTADGRLGVIDFGDVVRTQRVNDLAVAMADHVEAAADPFGPALDVAAGYLAVASLDAEELDLLYPLVRTRTVTRIVAGEWRASRFPANREYLARNVERLEGVLEALPERPSAADSERLATLAAEAGR